VSLENLMATQLPLNRKERYYTGTVFPMIVCRRGFQDFSLFTSLIEGFPQQEISVLPHHTNIQFFTEYSLAESIYGTEKNRFPDPPLSRDTPDILILIQGDVKVLIAIEAKMYDLPLPDDLRIQMERQRKILDYIQSVIGIDEVFHIALLPKPLSSGMGTFPYPIMTWEALHERYSTAGDNDYFLEVLQIALDHYNEFVSKGVAYGQNCEMKLRGMDIYRGYKQGTLPIHFVGRDRGLYGVNLAEDLASGNWRTRLYETNSQKVSNKNWFPVEEFVTLIDEQQGDNAP
jgi:hypothetical protein